MSSILLTGPAVEPLSLDDARSFLRVENGDDDPLIAALIVSARMHVEGQGKTALISQDWRPLKALKAARVYDCHGQPQTIDTHAFVPDRGASTLAFMPWTMPVPGRIAAGIELDVTVGFGDAAADLPEPLRQAIRLLVAHWYENRGLVAAADKSTVLPSTVAALISSYRVLSL